MTENRHQDKRILGAAYMFMLAYLSDGVVRMPEDFDREILGEGPLPGVLSILSGEEPVWNKTIFADALEDLVQEGRVRAWQDEKGCWNYQISIFYDRE